jgi:nucleotide-binding universal stress UspA family protein
MNAVARPRRDGDTRPDDELPQVRAVLLASEGREIPKAAIDLAARVARASKAPVHVFTIARIWGTTFGFPSPGLMPTKKEWATQRQNVDRAIARLERKGLEARGRVIGTRAGAKRIVREAGRLGCDAIVMGADPPRHVLVRNFMWSQEPQRVARRANVPVYLVTEP